MNLLPLLALCLTLVGCSPGRPLLPFPRDFYATGLACDEDWVVAFGHVRAFTSSAPTAVILHADISSTSWNTAYSGADETRTGSNGVTSDGGIFALIRTKDLPVLLWSTDNGRGWTAGPKLPSNVIGVAFSDSKKGYAWDSASAYRTETGGLNWSQRHFPELFAAGSPVPTIGLNDGLWVVQRVSSAAARESIIHLSPDLEIDQQLQIPDHVDRMIGTDDGVRLFLREGGYGSAHLVDLVSEESGLERKVVANLGADLPLDYVTAGSSRVVMLSDTSNLSSHRYLQRSSNAGRSWDRVEMSGASPQVLCTTASHIWVAGREFLWHVP